MRLEHSVSTRGNRAPLRAPLGAGPPSAVHAATSEALFLFCAINSVLLACLVCLQAQLLLGVFQEAEGLPMSVLLQLPVWPCDGSVANGCAICLQQLREGELVRTLPCLHMFHNECIKPWLYRHATCPDCRSNVVLMYSLSDCSA